MEWKLNLDEYLQELSYLVSFDSGSRIPEGTAKVAEYFTEKFNKLGWNVEYHYIDDAIGPCLEITNNSKDSYDILFIGHMDTVFPRGMAQKHPLHIEGNKLHALGANDMKASILSAYYALKALQENNLLENINICLLLNSDEELSSIYSRPLIEQIAKKTKYALILEPARKGGEMVKQRRGVARYKLEGHGIASHSGVNPWDGSSAINELAHWILELHAKNNLAKNTSVNVGLISGGTGVNVVSPTASAEVDVRFSDMEEVKSIEKLMRELEANPRTKGGAYIKATGGVTRPPMNPTTETLTLCDAITEISKKINVEFKWIATGGGSDASFTAACGVPTLDGFGPVGGDAHTTGEYLLIDTIKPRWVLLLETVKYIIEHKIK